MIATLVRHFKCLNKDRNNRDFKTRMLRVKGERCLVALFKFFVERRPLNVGWSGPFYFSIKWNRKFYDHLAQTKPVGENTIRNIVTTIRRWYFCLALKKARIKFTNHSARKQQSQSEESKYCVRWGIVMVTGHRSVNFPRRLRWSRRRRATATLSYNIQTWQNYENPSTEKKQILVVSNITTTVAPPGSRHGEGVDVQKASPHFPFLKQLNNNWILTKTTYVRQKGKHQRRVKRFKCIRR